MAYAAVMSLKHNIKHLIDPTIINPQITRDAYSTLGSLGGTLKTLDTRRNRSFDTAEINRLDAEIRKAVWKLEDVLESDSFYHSLPPSHSDSNGVEQEIQSFIETAKKLRMKFNRLQFNPLKGEEDDDDDGAVLPTADFGGSKSTTIGLFNDAFQKIIEWLELESNRLPKIVTLLGMAGIGKTHFAREIYQHPLIVNSFDFTAWVKVGQKCPSPKNIFLQIVAQVEGKPRNLYADNDVETLSALLGKRLDGRRCLVVLDDIWSEPLSKDIISRLLKAGVKKFLQTTRIQNVGELFTCNYYYKSTTKPGIPNIDEPYMNYSYNHMMPFWNSEKSWNLLWQNVFPGESSFPPQLEKSGKKIAEDCEGLPLLILAVADILSGEDKTEDYWNKVATKKTTTFLDAYEKISEILSSSYDYLPEYLKACFLYMGVFPQTREIPLRKLINLLTVEDFLEPNTFDKHLEDFIFESAEKLVSNSVVISCTKSYNNKIKSCKLHSAYWYMCVKEARKNKFFHALNTLIDSSKDYIESQRRLSIQNNMLFGIEGVRESVAATSMTRSLLFTGEVHQYPVSVCFNLMFLKVLDALAIRFYEFPEEVVKLLLLRYLALTHNGKLPSSISNLQQLQFLIVSQHHNIKLLRDSHSTFLPKEIWEMQQLKYIRIMGLNLPDPINSAQLPKLSTLYVNSNSCTEAIFKCFPNLKKIGIIIELQPDSSAQSLGCLEHIGILEDLKSLKCVIVNPRLLRSQIVAPPHQLSNLPKHLKKLSLNGLGCSWKCMTAIGSLAYLEVLKVRCFAFQGPSWETEARQFQRLQYLLLEDIDLVEWTISEDRCFPALQCLTIRHCYKLKAIPREIRGVGVINWIKMEFVDCNPSVVASELKMPVRPIVNSSWNL